MKATLSIVLLLTMSLVVGSTCLAVEKIVIEGTGDSQDLLRQLAKAYEKVHPGTHIEVPDTVGTIGGIRSAADGKCDFGRTARKLKDKEKVFNLNYVEFAYSPVVIIANIDAKRPDNLSSGQIVDIFSGKLTSWDAIGGEKQPIYVVNRQEEDSARLILEQNIPGFKEIKTFPGKVLYTTPEAVDVLQRFKNTIGYGHISMIVNSGLTVMKIDGIYPTIKNVQSGAYKYMAPFGLVWKGELTGLAKGFLDFLFTKDAQAIITKYGTVPVPSKPDLKKMK